MYYNIIVYNSIEYDMWVIVPKFWTYLYTPSSSLYMCPIKKHTPTPMVTHHLANGFESQKLGVIISICMFYYGAGS